MICDANEFFHISCIVLIRAKISFFAETEVHSLHSEARISFFFNSILLIFMIIVFIFDISDDICFKTDENSSIVLTSDDDFCKLIETTTHLTDSEAEISSIDSVDSISLEFSIAVLISDKSHDIFFKVDEDS